MSLWSWLSRGRSSRFGPRRPRPKIGIITQYAVRKGITTLCRAAESALAPPADIFPVRKISRLDREFETLKAFKVPEELRHERLATPGTRLVDWLEDQDVVLVVERLAERLFAHCRERGLRTGLIALLDWLPPEREERRRGLARVDACIVHSEHSRKTLEEEGHRGLFAIPPSLPWDSLMPRQTGAERVFYFNIGVGGTQNRRNVALVVRSFNALLDRYPQARLVMKMLPRARKYIPEIGRLHPRIELIERAASEEEMRALQSAADVSLFPSRFEGLGYPLLESLHCGVPVIATDGPPMNEIIAHEENGLLVPARASGTFGFQTIWDLDEAAFAAAVERLMAPQAAELVDRLKAGARAGIEARRRAFAAGWDEVIAALAPLVVNLGAGEDQDPGALNLDIRPLPGIDVVAEARRLPFLDGAVDELRASDLLEHFPTAQAGPVLDEWLRILKPGGKVRVQTPDLRALCRRYLEGRLSHDEAVDWLYGGQDHSFNFHQTGFDEERLRRMLEERGIVDIRRVRDAVSSKNVCLEGRRKRLPASQ